MKLEGFHVHDARRSVMLRITKADAASGQKDPATCAAAKASCRLPGVIEARIYRSRSYLLYKNKRGQKHWKRFVTPYAIKSEMISFDRGSYFDPGDYMLLVPGPTSRLGRAYAERKRKASSGKTKPRSKPHIVKGIRKEAPKGWGR